jgi:hypothetical protein
MAKMTLEQAVAEQLLRLRKERQARQEDLAFAAQKYGLPWTQATVAAIEKKKRMLTLAEFLLLPLLLSEADKRGGPRAGARVPDFAELVPPAERCVQSSRKGRVP